jgi:hypothetical protein
MWAENSDIFIEWFRCFQNIRNKWGIINSDIYNIDKLEAAIDLK